MHPSIVLSALFAAGALSVPLSPRAVAWVTHIKVIPVTVVEPAGWKPPKTTTSSVTPTPLVLAQKTSTTTHTTTHTTPPPPPPSPSPPPPSAPVVQAPKPAAPAPAPVTPAKHDVGGSSDGSPLSGGVSMLTTLNEWRSSYSLDGFEWSSSLASNSAQTGSLNKGFTEDHHLFTGSFAQVITPCFTDGSLDSSTLNGKSPFWYAMTALLCEVPGDPQLGGQCPAVDSFMGIVNTETGHHDILVNPIYKKAGCSYTPNPNGSGRWSGQCVCDFGF